MIVQVLAFKGFSKDRATHYKYLMRVDLLRKVPDARYSGGWRTDHISSDFTYAQEVPR